MSGLWWLPFGSLLRRGRLARWQELRGELGGLVGAGCLPLFISHRWLATEQPDPTGRQARLLAWQLVAALCEAVHVASARGLHEARRVSNLLGCRIGVGSSDLVEAMIVALLRPNLDDELLAAAIDEARSVDPMFDATLVQRADVDDGLAQLRDILNDRPVLAGMAARIHLWIDYCCLPQPPRTEDEQDEFVAGLGLLNAAQMLGRTVVLLDEVDEYTRRAWCLLEVLTAVRYLGGFDVVSGLPENNDPVGTPYRHLSNLLMDLPHLVWRALLDAEVFRRFDWDEALDRLEVSVTDPADLPYIYDRLRSTPGPTRIHTAASDLITGVFPLPLGEDGLLVLPDDGRPADVPEATGRGRVGGDVLTLAGRGSVGATTDIAAASMVPLTTWEATGDGRPEAHVAVVGACEGEAVLISDYVDADLATIEAVFGAVAVTRTWIADDVAPVGAMPFGGLTVAPVRAPNWIVVTTDVRRGHCTVTAMLVTAARRAGVGLAWISVDTGEMAVEGEFPRRTASPSADADRRPPPDGPAFTAVLGGVYRRDLAAFVRRHGDAEVADDAG
jgi:hypothetical protein